MRRLFKAELLRRMNPAIEHQSLRDPNVRPRSSYERFVKDETPNFIANLVGDLLLESSD